MINNIFFLRIPHRTDSPSHFLNLGLYGNLGALILNSRLSHIRPHLYDLRPLRILPQGPSRLQLQKLQKSQGSMALIPSNSRQNCCTIFLVRGCMGKITGKQNSLPTISRPLIISLRRNRLSTFSAARWVELIGYLSTQIHEKPQFNHKAHREHKVRTKKLLLKSKKTN